jgi:hypothetical protein
MRPLGDSEVAFAMRVDNGKRDGTGSQLGGSQMFGAQMKPALAGRAPFERLGDVEFGHCFLGGLQVADAPGVEFITQTTETPLIEIARHPLQD